MTPKRILPPPFDPGYSEFTKAQQFLRMKAMLLRDELPEKWFVEIQGSVVRFRKTGGKLVEPPSRLDSQIGPMSKASRLRLLTYLNKVDWTVNERPAFVTLTYPDSVVHRDYSLRSRDRYLFLRYIEKYRGEKTPCVWRVEWKHRLSGQRMGKLMPHWHLLLPSVKTLSESVVREFWRKAIGHDDTYLDVDVRFVEGPDAAARYVAKYCSKQSALGIVAYRNSGFRFGRHWGVTRKAMIPLCPLVVQRRLTGDEILAVKQFALDKFAYYDFDEGGGFTLLSSEMVSKWKEFLD